jgi:hypothetical protein
MLMLFPVLAWVAAITAGTALMMLWLTGELDTRAAVTLLGWLVVAAACQFFASQAWLGFAGLVMQTVLAVYLVVRWKLGGV